MHGVMLHCMAYQVGTAVLCVHFAACMECCAVASEAGNAPRLLLLHARCDAACHIKWGQRCFVCISPHG